MGELRAWIEANALSVSREEIVNPFARSSIDYRRKLAIEPKKDGASRFNAAFTAKCIIENGNITDHPARETAA